MILTDSEDALSEEQFSALETLHRSEGSAWLGRDLRQAETGARLKSNLSAMNRARVWTSKSMETLGGRRRCSAKGRRRDLTRSNFGSRCFSLCCFWEYLVNDSWNYFVLVLVLAVSRHDVCDETDLSYLLQGRRSFIDALKFAPFTKQIPKIFCWVIEGPETGPLVELVTQQMAGCDDHLVFFKMVKLYTDDMVLDKVLASKVTRG